MTRSDFLSVTINIISRPRQSQGLLFHRGGILPTGLPHSNRIILWANVSQKLKVNLYQAAEKCTQSCLFVGLFVYFVSQTKTKKHALLLLENIVLSMLK